MFDNLEPKKEKAALNIYLAILKARLGDIDTGEYESKRKEILDEFSTEDQLEILLAVVDCFISLADEDE